MPEVSLAEVGRDWITAMQGDAQGAEPRGSAEGLQVQISFWEASAKGGRFRVDVFWQDREAGRTDQDDAGGGTDCRVPGQKGRQRGAGTQGDARAV